MGRWRPPTEKGSPFITPDGEARMREELNQLWRVERPIVTKKVQEAAAEGDRSENAEYIYGKKRLREIDARIRFLTKRLEVMKVVRPDPTLAGKIYFGAWVALEDEAGELSRIRIVGPDEFNPELGWISMDSPMGKSLLGKKEGDEVLVKRPKGDTHFTVLEARYTPFDD